MLDRIQGMPAVGATAQSGIAKAVSRFAAAAAEVAGTASKGASGEAAGPDTATFSSAARAQLALAGNAEDSLEHGMIEETQAKSDLTANVRVLQTADEVMGALLSIGSRQA
jgi:hypothetical protein